MKTIIKQAVGRIAQNPFGWSICQCCGRLSDYLGRIYGHARYVRDERKQDAKLTRIVSDLFPTLTVAHGPFAGLRYPGVESYGSMLLPKLLGSYESEIHPALEHIFKNDYTTIVDIGCAEGYYAVGLALRFPRAIVYAFDTSTVARKLCAEMAQLNGVENRVHIGGTCDEHTLESMPLGQKALVISDCEGYENALFTRNICRLLLRHDAIIEAHDFIDIETSPNMRNVFSATHDMASIRSTDDIEKAQTYRYEELSPYTMSERREILAERRPGTMRWWVMTSREQSRLVSPALDAKFAVQTGN